MKQLLSILFSIVFLINKGYGAEAPQTSEIGSLFGQVVQAYDQGAAEVVAAKRGSLGIQMLKALKRKPALLTILIRAYSKIKLRI